MDYKLEDVAYIINHLNVAKDALKEARAAMIESDYNIKGYDKMLVQVCNYVVEYETKYGRIAMGGKQ